MTTAGVELGGDCERALAALAATAEDWGAEWHREGTGGRLRLPVVAGLRRGWVAGTLSTLPAAADGAASQPRCRLLFEAEERQYRVHPAAVVILAIAACGAVLTVLWPFFPDLLPVAPFGAILALGGWFLVITRLRNSGPEELLEAVRQRLTEEAADGGGARP